MDLEEMTRQLQQGNQEVFPMILKDCQRMIFKIISAYRLTQGDFFISRDDLYQEASLALYEAALAYKDDRGMKFSSFAYLVIKRRVNRIYNSYRSIYRREPSSIDAKDGASENIPDTRKAERGNEKAMEGFLKRLCEEDRRILEMRLTRKGYKEIARELGISSKRVDNRIYRMRKNYRDALRKENISLPERRTSPLTKEAQ